MEKRVFIAVLLSIAVMYVYSYLVPAPPKSPAVQPQQPVQPAPVPSQAPQPVPALPPAAGPQPKPQ